MPIWMNKQVIIPILHVTFIHVSMRSSFCTATVQENETRKRGPSRRPTGNWFLGVTHIWTSRLALESEIRNQLVMDPLITIRTTGHSWWAVVRHMITIDRSMYVVHCRSWAWLLNDVAFQVDLNHHRMMNVHVEENDASSRSADRDSLPGVVYEMREQGHQIGYDRASTSNFSTSEIQS